jgi:hypothetical protein
MLQIASTIANGQDRIMTAYIDAARQAALKSKTKPDPRGSSAYATNITVTAATPKASSNIL